MSFLFNLNKKNKLIAIFDIGSGSVGGAIVSVPCNTSGGRVPTILDSVRCDIKTKNKFLFSDFINEMTVSLNTVASSLLNKNLGAPDRIFCVLASPWYLSENKIVKIEKNRKFIFDNKLANAIIKEEVSKSLNSYKEKYENSTDNVPDVIEEYILSVSLDGRYYSQPIDKKCKKAELNMITSFSSSVCINKIKEITSRYFHGTKVNFASFTLMTHLALQGKYIKDNSYLLVDIAGEITDIGVVIDGVLKSNISFPIGKRTFLKNICDKLGVEMRDAKEYFKLFTDKNLFKSLSVKISPIVKESEESWIKSFNQSVSTLASKYQNTPNIIYLTTDNDAKKFFTNVISSIKYPNAKNTNYKYIVENLDSFGFSKMCNFVDGQHDPFIIIEAIAISNKLSCQKL